MDDSPEFDRYEMVSGRWSRKRPRIPEPQEINIIEKTFAKTDQTDAILLVDGKKLHVNKALPSYHSAYFKTLFNSDFKEKSIKEIPIEGVDYEEFATLLSLVQVEPIKPTQYNVEKLLELSDQFLLPAAKRHLELSLIATINNRANKIRIGDKYQLNDLIENAIREFLKADKRYILQDRVFIDLSDSTKVKILSYLLNL